MRGFMMDFEDDAWISIDENTTFEEGNDTRSN